MSITGTEIRVKAFPRMTSPQIAALAGVLLLALASGLVLGRVTSPGSETNVAASEAVISTRWLDETPAFQEGIMARMNELPVGTSSFIGAAETPLSVMSHMNELATPGHGSAPVGVRVMRHMNQILTGKH